jgi:hypothetical protein
VNRGTVMIINRKWATVFTQDCLLVKVRLTPDMAIGKEINMDANTSNTAIVAKLRLKPAMIAASLVLLLAVGLVFSQGLLLNPVYATVAIDVNPSLELYLDRNLEVRSVHAMNEETVQLMIGQDFKGLNWQQAVAQWVEALRLSNQVQVQNMLISAVMPENAEQLRTQLIDMEGTDRQGPLAGIDVRIIYSNDPAISKRANEHDLSIGRQMLLNQALLQNRNWNEQNIADAPLGELIQTLLKKGDQNQTRLTERTTQSLSEQSTISESKRETSRETIQSSNGSGSQNTNKETNQSANRETNQNGSINTSATTGTGSGSQQSNQYTNQQSSQSGSTGTGGAGSQQSSQNTSQQSNQTSGFGAGTGGPIASKIMSQETIRDTLQVSEQSTAYTTCESSLTQQTSQIKATSGR